MKDLRLNFAKRIPHLEQIARVYAVMVVIIYSWSLFRFFWRLPGWLYYSSMGEIGVMFTYMMVVNLIESLVVLLAPLFLSIVLPQKWFSDRFVTKGTLLVLMGLGYLIYFSNHLHFQTPFPVQLVTWTPAVAIAILGLVFLIDRAHVLDKALDEITSRLVIFLYISIPVSLVSVLVVLVRNII